MTKRDLSITVFIAIITLLMRVACMEHAPLLYDSGNFFLAADDFNIAQDRPHLPGYYLHVYTIKLFRFVVEPFAANVAPSIMWSALGCAVLYLLARRFTGTRESLFVTLLIATNPLVWFFGCTSEVYSFDLFFSVTLLYVGLHPRLLLATPLLMAFALGVRQSSPVLLLLVYIWLWVSPYRTEQIPIKYIVVSHVLAGILLCAWLLPMLNTCGGLQAYIALYHTHNPLTQAGIMQNIVVMASYAVYTMPAFVVLYIWIYAKASPSAKSSDKTLTMALRLWLVIPVGFFALEFYGKGYFLLCIATLPLFVIHRLRTVPVWGLIGIVAMQVLVFVFAPTQNTNADIWVRTGMSQSSATSKVVQRVRSVYAPVYSQLHYMNSAHTFADSVLLHNKQPYVFVDPTFPLSSRALQAHHPEQTFVTLLVRENGKLQFHHHRDIHISEGLRSVLDSCIILTTANFTQRYGIGYFTELQQYNNLQICTTNNTDSTALLYNNLFVK
ncbi:MAG: hypothetical protein JNJ85_17090 [Candidatus Kapabacteria bacterium]|nr:hypothetical protein [Candidatus Kapabacteria bacterium]